MRRTWLAVLFLLALTVPPTVFGADTKGLVCVGLYSESSDGQISWRIGKGDWKVVGLGDTVPITAEIRINVPQDWIEFTASGAPTKVFDLEGKDSGDVLVKAADVLKGASRSVAFPKKSENTDPAFKDKLVATKVWGRQVYRESRDKPEQDIRYGDLLDIKGKVRIIGINNTLTLMFPNGAETTVVGPLSFDVQKVFAGTNLYKYLNVTK
jgi:hypothetical protein